MVSLCNVVRLVGEKKVCSVCVVCLGMYILFCCRCLISLCGGRFISMMLCRWFSIVLGMVLLICMLVMCMIMLLRFFRCWMLIVV